MHDQYSGFDYFYNTEPHETTWEKPLDYVSGTSEKVVGSGNSSPTAEEMLYMDTISSHRHADGSAFSSPQKRIASDGYAYTREEFEGFYGGFDEWNSAEICTENEEGSFRV